MAAAEWDLLGEERCADQPEVEACEHPDPLDDRDEDHQITRRVQTSCQPDPLVGNSASNENAKFDEI